MRKKYFIFKRRKRYLMVPSTEIVSVINFKTICE